MSHIVLMLNIVGTSPIFVSSLEFSEIERFGVFMNLLRHINVRVRFQRTKVSHTEQHGINPPFHVMLPYS